VENDMPTFRKHKSREGATTFTACVRIAGFQPAAKTFGTRKAAAEWAEGTEDLLREQKKRASGVRRDVAVLTLGDLLLEFLKDPDVTKLRTFDDLHRLCAWWIQDRGTLKALELNVLVLREAREKLSRDRGPATTNRYLSALRSAWNWARAAGLVPSDRRWPERLLLTEPRGRVRFLSDDELAAVLEAAAKHSVVMHASIMISVATGLRQGELLRLDWQDIDLAKQTVRIRISKNDEPRTLHLPQSACDALKTLQGEKVRALSGAVFVMANGGRLKKSTIESRWRVVRDAAGLKDFHWHDLRHSCASIMAQSGATLLQIAEQLGHKSFAMTQRYSHLVQGAALPAHAALNAKLTGKRP
jgi:integrase